MRQGSAAGRQAHEVVGLYGDPDTTWGICLELGLSTPVDGALVVERLAALVAAHPHLGPVPPVLAVPTGEWERYRETAASAAYELGGPLLRVLLDGDGHVLVAAHHGVVDGLGLLAVAEAVCGVPLASQARGIGDRPAPHSFLRSSLARVAEALLRPPPRFESHHVGAVAEPTRGEHLAVQTLPRCAAGTAALGVAVAAAFAGWNTPRRGSAGQPLLVVGASRRTAGELAPDRRTAYLRFRLDPSWDRDQVRAAFARVAPEPEFPETSAGGIGPRVTRLLRSRLGGTAQLSNLGVVESPGLDYAAMFPALSGPRAFAVGLVSTTAATTLSLRTRGSEFSAAETVELLDLIAAALRTG
ncbi:MAG: hypothetical protein JWQ74_794 [Marmoricola sp.]|nr:hypothetical protein [Marmoricola sp.]